MGRPRTIYTQAVSSINYFFLRAISGKDNCDVINQELGGFIEIIAERYPLIDGSTRSDFVKEIKRGQYFKDAPIDQIEPIINKALVRITGNEYPSVAHFYANLVKNARGV